MEKHHNDPLRYAANLIGFSAAIYFTVYFALSFVAGLVISLLFNGASLSAPLAVPEWVMGTVNLLLSQGSLAAAFFAIRFGEMPSHKAAISIKLPHDKRLWGFVPIFLTIGVFTNVFTTLLARFGKTIGIYKGAGTVLLPDSAAGLVMYFIAICAVPAVMEELLVRGAMQGLLQRWGPWFSILVSSFIFTLLHGDIVAMPSIFLLSVLLGLTAYCTQSIAPGMLLHFANNTLAFIVALAGQKGDSATMQVFTLYIMAMVIIVGIICAFFAVKANTLSALQAIPRFHDPKNRQSRFERLVCSPLFIVIALTLCVRAILPLVMK